MEISRDDDRSPDVAPAEFFTGDVSIQQVFDANEHRQVHAIQVSFGPGARTAWHTHPAGQTLVVTSGTGWVQESNGPKQQVHPGDVIWTPPTVTHWHGATPDGTMTHLAINGGAADWLSHVTDDEYLT